MIKRTFIYTPTTGSKIFAASLQEPHIIAAFKMQNQSVHVFGGFHLDYPESSRKWRQAARNFIEVATKSYESKLKSLIAWDDKGSINVILPVEFAFSFDKAMRDLYRATTGRFLEDQDNLLRLAAIGDLYCIPKFDEYGNMEFQPFTTRSEDHEKFHLYKPMTSSSSKSKRKGKNPDAYVMGKDLGLKVQNTKMADGTWISTVYVDHRNYDGWSGMVSWEEEQELQPEVLFRTTGKLEWINEPKPSDVHIYEQDASSEECELYEKIDAPYHDPMKIKQAAIAWYEAKQEESDN